MSRRILNRFRCCFSFVFFCFVFCFRVCRMPMPNHTYSHCHWRSPKRHWTWKLNKNFNTKTTQKPTEKKEAHIRSRYSGISIYVMLVKYRKNAINLAAAIARRRRQQRPYIYLRLKFNQTLTRTWTQFLFCSFFASCSIRCCWLCIHLFNRLKNDHCSN